MNILFGEWKYFIGIISYKIFKCYKLRIPCKYDTIYFESEIFGLKGDLMERERVYIIYELLKSINKRIHKCVGCKVGHRKLNPSSMAIMVQLMDGKRRALKEISMAIGLANSTVSGIIDRLVEEGLVERVQDSGDRRRVMISATEKAMSINEDMQKKYKVYIENIFKNSSEEDMETVQKGLSKLYEIIEESEK